MVQLNEKQIRYLTENKYSVNVDGTYYRNVAVLYIDDNTDGNPNKIEVYSIFDPNEGKLGIRIANTKPINNSKIKSIVDNIRKYITEIHIGINDGLLKLAGNISDNNTDESIDNNKSDKTVIIKSDKLTSKYSVIIEKVSAYIPADRYYLKVNSKKGKRELAVYKKFPKEDRKIAVLDIPESEYADMTENTKYELSEILKEGSDK